MEDEQLKDAEEVLDQTEQPVEEPSPSAEELLALERDKFLRLFAEFENYKKRTIKERIELYKTANQEVMVSLLPVLDDFDRAQSEISKTEEKALLEGVTLIQNKLNDTLK